MLTISLPKNNNNNRPSRDSYYGISSILGLPSLLQIARMNPYEPDLTEFNAIPLFLSVKIFVT